MRVLILGLSSIVERRVLPALLATPAVTQIDVATHKAAVGELQNRWPHGQTFEDYHDGIAKSQADVVYVSLPNSAHEPWAEEAIRRGAHVVVDKPAFLGAGRAERLVDLAERHGVCLAEATVFGYHPQIQAVKNLLQADGEAARRVTALFSFPPLPAGNFRYESAWGGGALWDLGPYAVSVGRLFFGESPASICCHLLSRGGPDDLETAFSMLAIFPGGRSVIGHFGWDTVYRNRLDVLASSIGVEVDRVFTTSPDAPGQIRVTRPEGTSAIQGPCGDAFALFLQSVFASIERRDWGGFPADLLADARALQQLRHAAGVATNAD